MKLDPVAENVPPADIEPLARAPVEKLTEPKECPLGAVMLMKLASCDPVELITDEPIVPAPAVPAIPEIEMEPNWLVRSMPSAQAVIGTANASIAKITTRLITPPRNSLPFVVQTLAAIHTSCKLSQSSTSHNSPPVNVHLLYQRYPKYMYLSLQLLA